MVELQFQSVLLKKYLGKWISTNAFNRKCRLPIFTRMKWNFHEFSISISEISIAIFWSNSVPRLDRIKAVFALNLINSKSQKTFFSESHEMIYHFDLRYEIKRTIRFGHCVLVSTFSLICNASIIFLTKKYPCICCKVKQLENSISYHILPRAHTHGTVKKGAKSFAANQYRMRSIHCKW